MINKIKKIYEPKWVEMFYILLPLVEVITTVSILKYDASITLGMIYKTLFIIYSIFYLLFIDEKNKFINNIFMGTLLAFSIINITTTIDNHTLNSIFRKLIEMSKYICFPIVTLFIHKYTLNGKKIRLITLVYSATIYAAIIALAGITGTGIPTYSSLLEFGQSGWFYSGNEISVLMAMFFPIAIYFVSKYKRPIFIFATIVMTYGLLEIGTKTSFVAIILTVGITFIYSIYRYLTTKLEISKNMLIVSLLLIITIVFSANISPSLKFINNRIEIAKTKAKEDKSISAMDNLLFNGREKYVEKQMMVYKNAGISEKLLGIKDINKTKDKAGKYIIVERDTYDILIKYGLFGIMIYFVPIILLLLMFIKKVLSNFKEECNEKNYVISLSILLVLGISYIAGHVLLAPTVAIFLAFIFSKLNQPDDMKLLERRKKINSKNLKPTMLITLPKISVGGMETSLINLLNLSDYTNTHDITLMIGYIAEKELLKKIPENIKLKILCKCKWNVFGKLSAILNYIEEYFKILFKIEEYDVSICYSHHHAVLAKITRVASKNNICFIHTDIEKARTKKQIKKMKFDKFKNIVCVSNASKKVFEQRFPKYIGSITVINNYIDGERILDFSKEEIEDKKILKNILERKEKKIFINIARHLESAKKVFRILESSKKLKEEGYKFVVWLVGDGPDHYKYEEYIYKNKLNNYVILTGKQLNPYKYLKQSDALILSSEFEGYGMVIDEARVLKKPTISTDVADAKEITSDGYGILCDNSSNGVYLGMKEYLDNGYKLKKNFSYEKFNEKITKTLNDIV